MSWIALYFAKHPKHALAIGILFAVLLIALGLYFKGRSDADKHNEARRKMDEVAAQKSDVKANTKAAGVVQHDAEQIAAKREELENVVAKIPDSVPDAVAVAAGCVELQQSGISTANLPECRVVTAGAKTSPH